MAVKQIDSSNGYYMNIEDIKVFPMSGTLTSNNGENTANVYADFRKLTEQNLSSVTAAIHPKKCYISNVYTTTSDDGSGWKFEIVMNGRYFELNISNDDVYTVATKTNKNTLYAVILIDKSTTPKLSTGVETHESKNYFTGVQLTTDIERIVYPATTSVDGDTGSFDVYSLPLLQRVEDRTFIPIEDSMIGSSYVYNDDTVLLDGGTSFDV